MRRPSRAEFRREEPDVAVERLSAAAVNELHLHLNNDEEEWWGMYNGGRLVGKIKIVVPHDEEEAITLNYFVDEPGKGFATAAIKKVLEMFRGRACIAYVEPGNNESINVLRKLAFVLVSSQPTTLTYERSAEATRPQNVFQPSPQYPQGRDQLSG